MAAACLLAAPAFGIDTANDGMSDVWQQLYGIGTEQAAQDPDDDGDTNWREGRAGTDPFDALSNTTVKQARNGSAVTLSWRGAARMRYAVLASSNLVSWSQVGSDVLSGGTAETSGVTLPAAPSTYYRLRMRHTYDTDADGLRDWEEAILGTLEGDSDSDGDGMPDGWEFRYELDPFGDDSLDDPDEDTYSNLDEYLNDTDPRDAGSH